MEKTVLGSSRLAGIVSDLRTFLETVPEVLLHPRRFFAIHLKADKQAEPGSGWRPLPPFEHLGMGIGLATLATPVHQAMLVAGGFPDKLIELANRSPQDLVADFRSVTGRDMALLDLSAVTGVPLLDEPIEDLARVATYGLLAALLWLYSGTRLPLRPAMTYFAYAFGACLVLGVVANLLGDLLFLMLPGDWQERSAIAGIVSEAAGIVRLAFIVAVPAVIFPSLFGVARGVVIRAMVLTVLTWGVGGVVLAQGMLASGFVILGPGL